MIRTIAAAAILALAVLMPVQQAAAEDPVGGALLGGALGAIIGGAATGKAGGAVVGGVIGAATGAIIAQEADRRDGGYYWWRNRCYYKYPEGDWVRVSRRHCW